MYQRKVTQIQEQLYESEEQRQLWIRAGGPEVLFFAYREGLGPIFSSVYLVPALKLIDLGFEVKVLTLSAIGEWLRLPLRRRWKSLAHSTDPKLEGRIHRIPSPPSRWRRAWNEAPLLTRWLRWSYGRQQRVILHCGSSQATALALKAREYLPNLKIVYQIWGPEAAEYLFGKSRIGDVQVEAARLDALQRYAMKEADAIISISHEMTRWAIAEYGADKNKIMEVPCFVDTERFAYNERQRTAVRAELGLGDRFTVVYVGSMFRWQFPDGCFAVLKAIFTEIPGARFVAVTTSPNAMRARLNQSHFSKDAIVISVPYQDVPRYLTAADLAILGRNIGEEASVVNRISSPVKFGEYLACGLPVILSEGIGDFSRYVEESDLGQVIPHGATASQIERLTRCFLHRYETQRDSLRRNCRRFARVHLSSEICIPRLAALYKWLGRENQEADRSTS
jgi:glycosyltransferase involved in cell wall biosynthesis